MVQRFFAFNDWPTIHGSRRGFCYAFNYLCSSRSRVHKRSRRHLLVKLCLFSVEAENTVSAQCFFLLSQICWLRERSQHTVITAWNQPGLFEQLLNLGMWVWLNKIERERKINRETGPRCFVETTAPHHYIKNSDSISSSTGGKNKQHFICEFCPTLLLISVRIWRWCKHFNA